MKEENCKGYRHGKIRSNHERNTPNQCEQHASNDFHCPSNLFHLPNCFVTSFLPGRSLGNGHGFALADFVSPIEGLTIVAGRSRQMPGGLAFSAAK